MASGALSRGLAVLETLIGQSNGLALTRIAEIVELPKSAAHRILTNLIEDGYVRQDERSGNYGLTLKVVSLGLRHLASSTISDAARPVIARLATESGQLVRLALVDGEHLIWVAKAQGARSGLRYDPDPDHGTSIPLAESATGLAWLTTFSDDEAMRLVARQEDRRIRPPGHNAPKTLAETLERLHEAREIGWARVHDSNEEGISAMAAPLTDPDSGLSLGAVSIAGPSVQLTDVRMEELAHALQRTVDELSGLAASLAVEFRDKRTPAERID